MYSQEQLMKLKYDQANYQNRINQGQSYLIHRVFPRKALLERKSKELQGKTSDLAQEMRERDQRELGWLQEEIERVMADREWLKDVAKKNQEEIDKAEREIYKAEREPDLYIQEQVEQMIPVFIEKAKNIYKGFDCDVKMKFFIAGARQRDARWHDERYYGYTGMIGIFKEGADVFRAPITGTKDFNFTRNCFWRSSLLGARKTIWYARFVRKFTKVFLQKLEEAYKLEEDLKLTVGDGPYFILELV